MGKNKETSALPAKKTTPPECEHGVHTGSLTQQESERFKEILGNDGCEKKIKRQAYEIRLIIAAYDKDKITYDECTSYIRENINTAMEVARYLYIVKHSKLYLLKHDTFEKYINDEFKFTRERAYQLTRAHEVAVDVNEAIAGEPTIVNESQARELLRLRCFDKADIVDKKATKEARINLVKEVRKEDATIPAKLISQKVAARMEDVRAKNFKKREITKHKNLLYANLSGFKKKFLKVYSDGEMSTDERKAFKDASIEKLNALIKEIGTQD